MTMTQPCWISFQKVPVAFFSWEFPLLDLNFLLCCCLLHVLMPWDSVFSKMQDVKSCSSSVRWEKGDCKRGV